MNQLSANNSKNFQDSRYHTVLTLQDYIIILRIHLRKILFITLIALAIGIYYTYSIPPKYRATATVEIRENPSQSMVMDLSGTRNQNRMINEIQVIKSRALAKKVVKALWNSKRRNNLHVLGTRKFYPKGQRPRRLIKEFITFGLYDSSSDVPKKYDIAYNESIGDQFSGRIISGLSVNNVRNTNILQLTFTSPNADESRRIANIIAKIYIDYDIERSKAKALRSFNFLDSLVLVEEKKIFSVVGGYFQGLTKGEGNVYLYAISKEKKDSNEIDKIIMNEFKKIINEKLTSERFEIEKKKYFFDTIYKKDGVLNPAQIYGEALTVGLTLDDINKWQERLNSISLNDVKKALEKLYENKNYVIGELSN